MARMGIGGKIFLGFMALIVVGLFIGGAGYFSLHKIIGAGDLTQIVNELRTKTLDARRYEKNYIINKDAESHGNLLRSLDELEKIADSIKAMTGDAADVEKITTANQKYKLAAAELKKLEEEDQAVLKNLQASAARISEMARGEASEEEAKTEKSIVDGGTEALKAGAVNRVKDIIDLAYDVVKYAHGHSIPRADALETLRNMHYAGNNYFYVVQEDLTLVAHGADRSWEGKSFANIQDKKTGKTFMTEVVKNAVQNGEAYTEYYWNKPGMGDAVYPKITYSKYFKPWGLIICTGVYVDDIEAEAAKAKARTQEGLERLKQVNAIEDQTFQARLNAVYYFAFQQNGEKVAENLKALRAIPIATPEIRKESEIYGEAFEKRVNNNAVRAGVVAGIQETARSIFEVGSRIGDGATAAFSSTASGGKAVIIGFILVGGIGGVLLSFLIQRAITRPINRTISGIEDASGHVASVSNQVASVSQEMAEGASQQAAAVEETSSSLEEMASMTRQNAENASQANGLMKDAVSVVEAANQSMNRLTKSMAEISTASEETQKIIKTIDEIAFQTNLLALNAAVEAARAGEAGAGFAVVAEEVRNLAMRAAKAAQITEELIESTVRQIREGAEMVEQTNGEFSRVAVSVSKSGELIGEISAATSEQAMGIEQISKAVAEMDKVIQKNASHAEESAAASQLMSSQADEMKGYIGELVELVDGSGSGHAAAMRRGSRGHGKSDATDRNRLPEPAGKRTESPIFGKNNAREVSPEQIIPFDDNSF